MSDVKVLFEKDTLANMQPKHLLRTLDVNYEHSLSVCWLRRNNKVGAYLRCSFFRVRAYPNGLCIQKEDADFGINENIM